jgi:hypothetical protein
MGKVRFRKIGLGFVDTVAQIFDVISVAFLAAMVTVVQLFLFYAVKSDWLLSRLGFL